MAYVAAMIVSGVLGAVLGWGWAVSMVMALEVSVIWCFIQRERDLPHRTVMFSLLMAMSAGLCAGLFG